MGRNCSLTPIGLTITIASHRSLSYSPVFNRCNSLHFRGRTVMAPFFRLGLFLGALLVTSTTWAAITGSISGVVTDPSGAVIPGVTVVATSLSTNVKTTAVSDSKGFYSFPTLNVDLYTVTVSQRGFRDYVQTGVKIDANSALRIA